MLRGPPTPTRRDPRTDPQAERRVMSRQPLRRDLEHAQLDGDYRPCRS